MRVFSLDLAELKTGWCLGDAGAKPTVGVYKPRDPDQRTEEGIENFARWLREQLTGIDLLTVEHFLPSGALQGRTTDATREGAIMLNAAARSVAAISNVPFRSIAPATIRVHFIGRASMGDRASTKAAVIKRAQLLAYIPRGCADDNVADACALWDFSVSHFARKASSFALT